MNAVPYSNFFFIVVKGLCHSIENFVYKQGGVFCVYFVHGLKIWCVRMRPSGLFLLYRNPFANYF
jgi:hypothetical protein